MKVCRESLARLLRFGRKNSSYWEGCECSDCYIPDESDVDFIADALEERDCLITKRTT